MVSFDVTGHQSKQNIYSRKIVVTWEFDPLTPKVYLVMELQNDGLTLSLIIKSYILKQTWCRSVCVFVTDIRELRPGQPLRGAGRGVTAFYTSSVDA
jgi:hypothetical protein